MCLAAGGVWTGWSWRIWWTIWTWSWRRVVIDPGWREQLCTEADCVYLPEDQHIHCPWGGPHIHIVDDEGKTIRRRS